MRPLRSVIVTEIISGSSMRALLEDLEHRDDRRLGVERVEDRLDQQQVDAAVDEAAHLVAVGVAHLVEGDRAKRRVVRRPARSTASGWSARSRRRRSAGGPGVFARPLVGRGPGEPRRLEVQLVGERLEAVVGLRDARCC